MLLEDPARHHRIRLSPLGCARFHLGRCTGALLRENRAIHGLKLLLNPEARNMHVRLGHCACDQSKWIWMFIIEAKEMVREAYNAHG